MKRSIHILWIGAVLVSAVGGARAESLEERKQRIMRRYVQEHVGIDESNLVVPKAAGEHQKVLDSELYKQPEADLQRNAASSPVLPPPRRRPMPRTESKNWLLTEEIEAKDPYTDLYADPYADPWGEKAEPIAKKQAAWMTWGQDEDRPAYDSQRGGSLMQRSFGSASFQPSNKDRSNGVGTLNAHAPASFSIRQTILAPGTVFEGRQQATFPSAGQTRGGGLSGNQRFNSAENTTRLNNPFSRTPSSSSQHSFGSDASSRAGAYTPYKGAYQKQREQKKTWGSTSPSPPAYQRVNHFEQWKTKNKGGFNPTSDDAFINEMMPKMQR